MKTSKQKALELCMYFQNLLFINLTDEDFIHSDSKKCAIKCVSEILLEWSNETGRLGKHKYWEEVLNEIKLS